MTSVPSAPADVQDGFDLQPAYLEQRARGAPDEIAQTAQVALAVLGQHATLLVQ